MATRKLIVGASLLVIALVGAALFGATRLSKPAGAYRLVDETTLVVLRGQVQIQRGQSPFESVTADTTVRQGDRIRTGPDAYATLTFFDGSSTTLDPNTEIVVRRLEDLGGGGASISMAQEIGQTWNRVERLVGSSSRFEVTTTAGVAFVRDMADRGYFDHVSPEGEDPSARMLRGRVPGYRPGVLWGENLSIDDNVERAHARDLEEDLVPGSHHANIVDSRFRRLGIGIVALPGQVLITVLFLPEG